MSVLIEGGPPDLVVPGKGTVVTAGDNSVALFKIDGAICALEAWCLRCGSSLAQGTLHGTIVACQGCGWRYEVNTGAVVGIPKLRLTTFRVEVVGGQIIVADT